MRMMSDERIGTQTGLNPMRTKILILPFGWKWDLWIVCLSVIYYVHYITLPKEYRL